MKGLLKLSLYSFLLVFLATPLFAKTYTINISQTVAVGSIQIPAGEYKLSWDGAGPAVKVTLVRTGASPVVLKAKLLTQKNILSDPGVVTASEKGTVVLQEIQLKSNTLVFEDGDLAQK